MRLLQFSDLGVCRRRRDDSLKAGAGTESAVELHPEPRPEFFCVGEGAPDPGTGRVEQNGLLDAIGHDDCHNCNLLVAHTTIAWARNATIWLRYEWPRFGLASWWYFWRLREMSDRH